LVAKVVFEVDMTIKLREFEIDGLELTWVTLGAISKAGVIVNVLRFVVGGEIVEVVSMGEIITPIFFGAVDTGETIVAASMETKVDIEVSNTGI
jgi:hypothetical protein